MLLLFVCVAVFVAGVALVLIISSWWLYAPLGNLSKLAVLISSLSFIASIGFVLLAYGDDNIVYDRFSMVIAATSAFFLAMSFGGRYIGRAMEEIHIRVRGNRTQRPAVAPFPVLTNIIMPIVYALVALGLGLIALLDFLS